VSRKRAADFNQAVMDIGSQVCRPVDPPCPKCPLMPSCKTFESGRQAEIPHEKKKPVITDVVEVSIAVKKGEQFLLRQRLESERWAGLWDFVRFEVSNSDAAGIAVPTSKRKPVKVLKGQQSLFDESSTRSLQVLPSTICQQVEDATGLAVSQYEPVTEIRHAVTRYRIRLLCLLADVDAGRILRGSGYQWYTKKQLSDLPLSTTGRQFAELLQK
jgi:A/G-specific adenine glycosylase